VKRAGLPAWRDNRPVFAKKSTAFPPSFRLHSPTISFRASGLAGGATYLVGQPGRSAIVQARMTRALKKTMVLPAGPAAALVTINQDGTP
jgi:hypothetical protein